jgi:hypothetical protein
MITLSDAELSNLDSLYDARDSTDRPSEWGTLVAKLREIRRSIESGEAVKVHAGTELQSVLEFHTWAYRHYTLLEEGYDSWIGDDK